MKKSRKICCRITPRRILGAVVVAASIVNLIIVGTVLEASASTFSETATPTPTANPIMTTLFAPTATQSVLPSVTMQPSETSTQTSTSTATFTSTFTPTETMTPTLTATPWPTATTCTPWYWWFAYIVPAGDTLSNISSFSGASIHELMLANCLQDTRIDAGQLLYVPRLPVVATDTATQMPNVPTNFGRATVCLDQRGIQFSVIATDVEGIRQMNAFYRTSDSESGSYISMGANGDVYMGSQPFPPVPSAPNMIYYWFVSTDMTGSTAQSQQYESPPFSCGRG